MSATTAFLSTLSIGIGATLVMDLWTLMLKRIGVATLNYAMVGRWVGHMVHGHLRHEAIAKAAPIRHERALGWLMHYTTGLAFAALLVSLAGEAWLSSPTLWPALAFGLCSVVAPFCFMQPALGAGFFASRTAKPLVSCLRSVATHMVFGVGLFLSAMLVQAGPW